MPALAQNTARLLAFPGPALNLRAALTPALKRHRLPDDLIESLIRQASGFPGTPAAALAAALAARMRVTPLDLKKASHIFLLGPSGGGKTAVAAKLAHANPALVVTDSPGFNPQSPKARSAFAWVGMREGVETIGVISALGDAEEVREIITRFRLSKIIVTGLDMAARFGALAAAVTSGAGLVGLTHSPKPDASLENLGARQLAEMLLE